MKLRLALAAATCLVLPLAAHAQPVAGPYVAIEGGISIQNPVGYNAAVSGVPISGKAQYKPDYAGVVSLGYAFGNGFRVQLDGDDLHTTLHELNDSYFGKSKASGTHSTFGPMVNVLYDIPVGLPVTPYVGAGGGYQWVQTEFRSDVGPGFDFAASGTKASPAFDVIAGLSLPVSAVPGLSFTAEYRFMDLVDHTNYVFTGYGAPAAGSGKFGQQTSHNFFLGLSYALFPAPAAVAAIAPPPPAAPPAAAPAPAPARTFIVFFDWDKATLTPRATEIISEAASDSKTANVTTLQVSGYTDTSGTVDYNQGLSERRAEAVATKLEADGVPSSEIEIHAYGETHLLVQTGPGVREPQNRRVEIVLQ